MISNKVLAIQIFLVSNSAYIFTVTPDEYCGQEKKTNFKKRLFELRPQAKTTVLYYNGFHFLFF